MNKGWIKIHRSIIDTADFYDEPLCKMACWTDLIMMAEIEPQIRKSKCGDLFINRGEVAISIGKLAERWNHSVRHCRTIIGWLIKTERIQVRTDKQLTIIKIINYDKYQCTTTTDKVIDKVTDKVSDKVSDKVTDKVDFDVTTNDSTNYNDKKSDTDKVSDKVTDKVSDNIIKNNKEYIKNNIKKISTNVDIKESRIQNEIDFEKLCELWNQQMIENSCTIPQIQRITDRRKQAVLSRLREFSKDEILKVIENCARSDFLNGRNNRNFIASFDWAFLPNNFIEILEGNYNNKFENNPSYQNGLQTGLQTNPDKYFLRRGVEPKDYDEKDYHTSF